MVLLTTDTLVILLVRVEKGRGQKLGSPSTEGTSKHMCLILGQILENKIYRQQGKGLPREPLN
jgi:hypothetical protein